MAFDNFLDRWKILAECSFKEWLSSPFADDFIKKEKGGKLIFTTTKGRLVINADYNRYGCPYHKFYVKSPGGRWMSRSWDIVSDEKLFTSNVYLLAEQNSTEPYLIIFDVELTDYYYGSGFYLTDEMKKALMEAYESGYKDYFPDYN